MKARMSSVEDAGHGASLDLEQLKDRFAQWRHSRKPGERISKALWVAAVAQVEQYGVERVAQTLRLNSEQLKKRVARSAGPTRQAGAAPRFVELFAQPAVNAEAGSQCIVEMQNARGGKMRIELGNIAVLDGLVSAFWSAR